MFNNPDFFVNLPDIFKLYWSRGEQKNTHTNKKTPKQIKNHKKQTKPQTYVWLLPLFFRN